MSSETLRRKADVSALMSLVGPGLGQLYNGEGKKAILFLLSPLLAVAATPLLLRYYQAAIGLYVLKFVLYFLSVIDAFRRSRKLECFNPQWFNKDYIYFIVFLLTFGGSKLLSWYVRANLFEASKISSGSMEPTFSIGDYFMTDKSWYKTHPPQRGDIAVFSSPSNPTVNILMRIVAIPGDNVSLTAKQLIINNQAVSEPYARYSLGGRNDFGPVTVPEGKLLLFGDNRDQSKDSRHWVETGENPDPFLDISNLKGKALYIYYNSGFDFKNVGKKLEIELQKGHSGYFLCENDSDCLSLGASFRCKAQKYDCGTAETCGEKVCIN